MFTIFNSICYVCDFVFNNFLEKRPRALEQLPVKTLKKIKMYTAIVYLNLQFENLFACDINYNKIKYSFDK